MRCNEVEMMERGRCHSLCTVRGRQTTLLELVLQPASQLRFGSGPTAGHRSVVLCSLVLLTVLCCDVLSVNCWPCPRSLPAPVSGHPAMQAAAIPAFQAPKSNQRPHTTKVQYSKDGTTTPLKSPKVKSKAKANSTAKVLNVPFPFPFPSTPTPTPTLPPPLRHSINNGNHTRRPSTYIHVIPPSCLSVTHANFLSTAPESWALDSQATSGLIPIRVVAAPLESTSPPSTPSS
jgi:hypothetical protein